MRHSSGTTTARWPTYSVQRHGNILCLPSTPQSIPPAAIDPSRLPVRPFTAHPSRCRRRHVRHRPSPAFGKHVRHVESSGEVYLACPTTTSSILSHTVNSHSDYSILYDVRRALAVADGCAACDVDCLPFADGVTGVGERHRRLCFPHRATMPLFDGRKPRQSRATV
jgi:hypothetical protein